MTISFPLSLPSARNPRRITFEMLSSAGMSTSPFSLSQQVYENPGEAWGATLELGEMNRADAETWVAFMASLRGRYGTALIGDPLGTSPQGTWAGAPLVNGAHVAQLRTVAVDGFTVGATGKAGDWIQFGSGSSTRLHKVLQDFTANGSGQASIEIWPALRDALLDNAAFVTSSAKGLFRLAGNRRSYTLEDVKYGGIELPFIEAL